MPQTETLLSTPTTREVLYLVPEGLPVPGGVQVVGALPGCGTVVVLPPWGVPGAGWVQLTEAITQCGTDPPEVPDCLQEAEFDLTFDDVPVEPPDGPPDGPGDGPPWSPDGHSGCPPWAPDRNIKTPDGGTLKGTIQTKGPGVKDVVVISAPADNMLVPLNIQLFPIHMGQAVVQSLDVTKVVFVNPLPGDTFRVRVDGTARTMSGDDYRIVEQLATASHVRWTEYKPTVPVPECPCPCPPADLTLTPFDSGIRLTWSPNVEVVQGYNVYSASSPTGNFQQANSQPVTDTSFTLSNLPNGTPVSAKIAAVGSDGREGAFSRVVSGVPSAPPPPPPPDVRSYVASGSFSFTPTLSNSGQEGTTSPTAVPVQGLLLSPSGLFTMGGDSLDVQGTLGPYQVERLENWTVQGQVDNAAQPARAAVQSGYATAVGTIQGSPFRINVGLSGSLCPTLTTTALCPC